MVEQAAADEIAVLVTLQLEATAIDDELGALFDTAVDQAVDRGLKASLVTSGPISALSSV